MDRTEETSEGQTSDFVNHAGRLGARSDVGATRPIRRVLGVSWPGPSASALIDRFTSLPKENNCLGNSVQLSSKCFGSFKTWSAVVTSGEKKDAIGAFLS